MLIFHESWGENVDTMLDSSKSTSSALFSVSSQSRKPKNKWNKSCDTNQDASRGSNYSLSTCTNNFLGA